MQSTENGIDTQDGDLAQHWHALYTRHQHEKRVAHSLALKEHNVFLPIYGAVHRWRDRTKHLWLPLFPCYVFIRGGMDRQLQVLATPGVAGILRTSGRPSIVPQEQINSIRKIVQSSLRIEPYPYLECGDRVRVKAGILIGLEGILVRRKGLSKLIVSIELLGQSVAAEVDISCVEGIGARPVAMQVYPMSISL